MQIISIPSKDTYTNLHTLSTFPLGTSLIVTNACSEPLFLAQSETDPTASSLAYPVLSGQTTVMHWHGVPAWIKGGTGPVFIQPIAGTISPFLSVDLPHDVYTSANEKFRRFQVDVAQTGTDEGREFRTFMRFNIPNTTSVYMRFVSPVNFILFDERIVLVDGWIDSTAYRVVSDVAGVWTDLPQIGRNISSDRPTPFYTPVAKMQFGGTFTALEADEVGPPIMVRTPTTSAQATSIPNGNARERVLGAGTYYIKMTAMGNGNAVGCYYLDWEERIAS